MRCRVRRPAGLVVLIVVISVGGPGSIVGFDFARTFNPSARLGTAAAWSTWAALGLTAGDAGHGPDPGCRRDYSFESFRLAWTVQYAIWALATVGILITRKKARRLMKLESERMLLEGFEIEPTHPAPTR